MFYSHAKLGKIVLYILNYSSLIWYLKYANIKIELLIPTLLMVLENTDCNVRVP